ncbi:SLC13 family permease [Streptomyces sp. NPDC059255]|uniref:SLC13 family permease n=1 Tax=Streptomyces sp. NPDC059255 TaxID=3346793 RepID=UPI0036C0FABC
MLQLFSILAVVAVFVVATLTPLNMGLLAFIAAFVLGAASGVSTSDVMDLLPGDIVILLVGITLLFGIANVNGTVDLIVDRALKLVRGRRWAIVWMIFFLAAALMSLGMLLAVAMLAPIAMSIAGRYKINPLLMGMMLSHGALGAALSPITIFGAFTLRMARDMNLGLTPLSLFLFPFVFNLAFATVLFVVLGRGLFGQAEPDPDQDGAGGEPTPHDDEPGSTRTLTAPAKAEVRWSPERVLTLVGILLLLVVPAAFGVDVGATAMVIACALLIMRSRLAEKAMREVAWSAVLLVTGMMTLMAVLQQNGTLDSVGSSAARMGLPIVAALVLLVAAAALSAFGSSIGTIGIAIPMAIPLTQTGHVEAAAFVIAIAFCSTVVDISPFSTNGCIVLAEARVADRLRFQRTMLAYTMSIVVLAPLASWFLLLVL